MTMMVQVGRSQTIWICPQGSSLVEQLLKSSKSPSFVSIHLGWHIKILKQSNWINNFNSFWLKPQNTQTIQIDKWILLKKNYFFCTQYFWNTFTLLLTQIPCISLTKYWRKERNYFFSAAASIKVGTKCGWLVFKIIQHSWT